LWRKKEKDDEKTFNGQRMPRSGGLWSSPGDVKAKDFLFECKQTQKKSYSLNQEKLKKLNHEAILSSKRPALSLILGDKSEFIVLRKDDFLELINN